MRIGIFAPDLRLNHGWGNYSLNVLRALQAQGTAFSLASASNSPEIKDLEPLRCLPDLVPQAPRFLPRLALSLPQVAWHMRQCQVLHVFAEPYAPLAWAIAGKRPVFITAHGSYVHLPYQRQGGAGKLYQQAFSHAQLLCVSDYTAQVARQLNPAWHVQTILNGVDAERFLALERRPQATPLVLSVGAVKRRKGTLALVRAMAKVLEQLPSVQCEIIGSLKDEPHTVEAVENEIARLGIGTQVRLLGRVSDAELLDAYQRAWVFALPSLNDGWRFEGFGLVHLEAGAAGLPVVGTRECGIESAVDDEQTGLLVSQAQLDEQLPQALVRLLQDKALAQRLGEAGRAKARQQTWAGVAQALLDTYQARQDSYLNTPRNY